MSSKIGVSCEGVFGVTSSACLHSPSGSRKGCCCCAASAVSYSAVSYSAYSTDAPQNTRLGLAVYLIIITDSPAGAPRRH